MTESLREQQKRVARERIIHALADEIVERGVTDLSLLAVAGRAGVSERTLYNHFDNRENLLLELARWSNEATIASGGRNIDGDPDRLPRNLRTNFKAFASQGNVVKALIQLDAASAAEGRGPDADPDRDRRTSAVRAGLEGLRPDLTPDQLDAVTGLVRSVASSRTWYRLTTEHGLTTDAAAEVTAWALATLRDALADGRGPFDS